MKRNLIPLLFVLFVAYMMGFASDLRPRQHTRRHRLANERGRRAASAYRR